MDMGLNFCFNISILYSPEFRRHQSETTREIMAHPEVRKKYREAIRRAYANILSDNQKLLLFILYPSKHLFLTDFCKLVGRDRKDLDSKLRTLFKRGYLNRVKARNEECLNSYKSHYLYSLTKEGSERVSEGLKDGSFNKEELAEQIKFLKKGMKFSVAEFIQKENIGPNQFTVLKVIQNSCPKFLVDLVDQLGIPKKAIDRSLASLSARGFLTREKKLNLESQRGHKYQFFYSLTDKCPQLI